jgi:hypothetical protein
VTRHICKSSSLTCYVAAVACKYLAKKERVKSIISRGAECRRWFSTNVTPNKQNNKQNKTQKQQMTKNP